MAANLCEGLVWRRSFKPANTGMPRDELIMAPQRTTGPSKTEL